MREKKKVVTLCSGYDSQCMALDELKKRHPDFDYELVAWSEIDKYAVQMHNLVYPEYADRNLGDMTKIDWQPIKEKYGEIDLLTYSTPCQSISQAGMQHGFAEGSGTRSSILWSTEEAIRVLRPKFLLQENVKAIISGRPDFYRKGKDGKMTETFWSLICKWMKRVESYGYTNTWSIINAKHQGVPQNRERFFLLSQREDVTIDYSWPKSKPLTTRLEDILEEEVADRYFLKDDAVSKFLKANDSDNALFVQFDLPPTHEAAMFLKTWIQIFMERHDGWSESVAWVERELNYQRPAVTRLYGEFQKDHRYVDLLLRNGFEELFKENMERKKDEN